MVYDSWNFLIKLNQNKMFTIIKQFGYLCIFNYRIIGRRVECKFLLKFSSKKFSLFILAVFDNVY